MTSLQLRQGCLRIQHLGCNYLATLILLPHFVSPPPRCICRHPCTIPRHPLPCLPMHQAHHTTFMHPHWTLFNPPLTTQHPLYTPPPPTMYHFPRTSPLPGHLPSIVYYPPFTIHLEPQTIPFHYVLVSAHQSPFCFMVVLCASCHHLDC